MSSHTSVGILKIGESDSIKSNFLTHGGQMYEQPFPKRKLVVAACTLTLISFCAIVLQVFLSENQLLNSTKLQDVSSEQVPKTRFTSLNVVGLRNREGQGVYNIPVENRNSAWDIDEFPENEFDQELRDPQQRAEDISKSLLASDDPDQLTPTESDNGLDATSYADFYRAYSAYQLPREASNLNPRSARAQGRLGWTPGAYGLPRHGLPYSRPPQLRRQPPPLVSVSAGGDGSSNFFRVAGPGVINVTAGRGGGYFSYPAAPADGAARGPAAADGAAAVRAEEDEPATDADWASPESRRRLRPCHPRDASLPWLGVDGETAMCLQPADQAAAESRRFWQDAYDDAYY